MADSATVRKDNGGYWVYVRFQGERHYITNYMGKISFRGILGLARKAADVINSEIDRGIFRPERWKQRAKKLFTVQGYSEAWLEDIEPELSAATLHDYKNSFKNHINPYIGQEYIEDLNLQKFNNLMKSIKRAPKGKKNVMGAFHRMMIYAYQNGHIPAMPLFPEFKGKNEIIRPKIRWLETKEQFRILEFIAKRHRPIFTFMMLTGCRPSEARAFRKEDVRRTHIVFAVTFGRGEVLKSRSSR